eukprot:7382408-Prymnesium_polylepis.2
MKHLIGRPALSRRPVAFADGVLESKGIPMMPKDGQCRFFWDKKLANYHEAVAFSIRHSAQNGQGVYSLTAASRTAVSGLVSFTDDEVFDLLAKQSEVLLRQNPPRQNPSRECEARALRAEKALEKAAASHVKEVVAIRQVIDRAMHIACMRRVAAR